MCVFLLGFLSDPASSGPIIEQFPCAMSRYIEHSVSHHFFWQRHNENAKNTVQYWIPLNPYSGSIGCWHFSVETLAAAISFTNFTPVCNTEIAVWDQGPKLPKIASWCCWLWPRAWKHDVGWHFCTYIIHFHIMGSFQGAKYKARARKGKCAECFQWKLAGFIEQLRLYTAHILTVYLCSSGWWKRNKTFIHAPVSHLKSDTGNSQTHAHDKSKKIPIISAMFLDIGNPTVYPKLASLMSVKSPT